MNTYIQWSITRPKKEKKSETLSIRLTPTEMNDLVALKDKLQFEDNREFVLFCFDVLNNIENWDADGYRFFLGKPEDKDYREIEFELKV